MKAHRPPRVKICCISSIDEAETAIEFGADAIGLVGEMPSGPGIISDEEIETIARNVPPPVSTFLLTSETNPDRIIQHHRRVHTNTIQIVDEIEIEAYEQINLALPHVKIVQVIHVMDAGSVEKAIEVSAFVDAILLDSGNSNLEKKELGGTGRVHDWSLSRKIKDNVGKPVFLAGGLRPENVREAIETINPFGLDLCSGVRTNGKLDTVKLEKFFQQVRSL